MRDFQLPGRSPVLASNGMCATSSPLATRAAIRILEDGGNAVDATIAGAFLLGICEPMMTGIGGDCFVLVKPADSETVIGLNGSGRAPAALNSGNIRGRGLKSIPLTSPDSVTLPGAVDAFCQLSDDWGRLDFAELVAPAIRYADAGVPVSQRTVFDWNMFQETLQGDARKFYLLDGNAPIAGQIFRHPQQAEVLRKIAKEGRAGFYEGEVAEDMVQTLRSYGGVHTLDDFAETVCNYTKPISGFYKDTELVEHAPNGQGATAILLANILANFDLSKLNPFGAQRAHLEAEAAKLAYDARDRFLADPDTITRLKHMLSQNVATELAALIDPRKAMTNPTTLSEATHKETVYITVVDKDRMAVSLIYSIFHDFGSGICSSKYGVLFQNRGAGFSLVPGHPNEAVGGKRPMHTIIPAMLKKDGIVTMPFGVMGGNYQPAGHARILTNIVDYEMDPQEAIDAPRSFFDNGQLMIERGYSNDVKSKLSDLGHSLTEPVTPIGGAQAIRIDHENGVLLGASDPRKDGAALGY